MKQWLEQRGEMLRGLSRRMAELDRFIGHRIPEAVGRVGGTSHVDDHADREAPRPQRAAQGESVWTGRLVTFLRIMAALALIKGLFHWSRVCGIAVAPDFDFQSQSLPYQTATIYFAVIELVAAVGLWLATPWGAVVWLTAVVSMAVVELMFPMIYGGNILVVAVELILLFAYLVLAFLSAHERPA